MLNRCRGAPRIFSRGGANFLPCIMASRVRKITLRKLFTMLQPSSVLPHSKKLKKTDFKNANHVI